MKEQIEAIPNYKELSKYDILEKLDKSKRGGINNVGKSIFSIAVFISVTVALFLFTFNIEFTLIFEVSIRRALLLLINIYYGFRD
ncbi:MAG: hypothetical protein KAW66_11745 [Candidatus Lokiarchaeota archaeon]|nr:hypothetical protein [Candidatus Lokiarchaeota archaeon]